MRISLILLCFFSYSFAGLAQNQSNLTIDQIMQGEGFVGYLPTSIRWTEDSQNITFLWNPDQDTLRSRYQVNLSDKQITNQGKAKRRTQQHHETAVEPQEEEESQQSPATHGTCSRTHANDCT